MRQTLPTLAILLLLIAGVAAIVTGPTTGAEQTLPTPQGQLGGPMPLPTQGPGQPDQRPSPTPPSTPTPEPATPEAGVPHPSECRVEARSVEELILLAQSDAVPPSPSTEGGVPANAATVDGISATIRELIACLNAGDHLRAAALLTDVYLARLLADTGWTPDDVISILGPLLPRAPERRLTVLNVTDVQTLPDGRAAATVTLLDPERFVLGGTTTYHVIFHHDGNRWRIDASATD